jgi:hypothetical protein
MTPRDLILQELEHLPNYLLDQVLVFLRFLKLEYGQDSLETALLSESALQKDWLLPEEEEAWQDL